MPAGRPLSKAEPLVKIGAGITARMFNGIEGEARRLGVSFNEALRRVIDKWLDDKERASQQSRPGAPVLVLDREKGEVRGAR